MKKESSKLPLLFVALLMLLCLGILYAWTVFKEELAGFYPNFTAASWSLNFTLLMIFFCLGGLVGGKLSASTSPRISLRVSACLTSLGLLGSSFLYRLPEGYFLPMLYLCYGVLLGLGVGIGYNACIGSVTPCFAGKQGIVSGALLMAFSTGSLLLGMLSQALAAWMPNLLLGMLKSGFWSSLLPQFMEESIQRHLAANLVKETEPELFLVFRFYAILFFVLLMLGSLFLPTGKKDRKKEEQANPLSETSGVTPRQMLCTVPFWIFFLWNVIFNAAGLLIIQNASNLAVLYGTASAVGLVVSFFNAGGRLLTGGIMDRWGLSRGMAMLNFLLLLSGGILLFANYLGWGWLICIGMFLVGLCYGGALTANVRFVGARFGMEHFSINLSLSNFVIIPASFMGPLLSGWMLDLSGGRYDGIFLLLTILAFVAFLLLFLLSRCKEKA